MRIAHALPEVLALLVIFNCTMLGGELPVPPDELWWTPLSRPKRAFNKLMLGESELKLRTASA